MTAHGTGILISCNKTRGFPCGLDRKNIFFRRKKRMKRILALILALVMCIVLIAACGGDDDPVVVSTPSPTPNTPAPPPETPTPTEPTRFEELGLEIDANGNVRFIETQEIRVLAWDRTDFEDPNTNFTAYLAEKMLEYHNVIIT